MTITRLKIRFIFLSLIGVCCVEQSFANQNMQNWQVRALDSLKTLYSNAKSNDDKARLALEITGFLSYKRQPGENQEQWLATSLKFISKSSNLQNKAYWYIYKSYFLPKNQESLKYKYLDSANDLFAPGEWEGRNFLLYIRIRFDLVYEMYSDAAKQIDNLKASLEAENARPLIWGIYYYQQIAQLKWNEQNYSASTAYFIAELSCVEKDISFSSGQVLVHLGTGCFINPVSQYASACNNIGTSYIRLDSMAKAIHYYKKSIEKYEIFDDLSGLAWTYQLIGECYMKIGMPSEAKSWYKKAVNEIEKTPWSPSQNLLSEDFYVDAVDLGDIFASLKNYDEWIKSVDSSYNYVYGFYKTNSEYDYILGTLLLQKAKAYACEGKLTEARLVLKQAGEYIHSDLNDTEMDNEHRYRINAAYVQKNMLMAWLAFKKNQTSKYSLLRDKAFASLENISDLSFRISTYSKIIWYLTDVRDYADLIPRHTSYFLRLHFKRDILLRRHLSGQLADAYAYLHRYDSAYKYRSIFAALSDSIHKFQRFYAVADLSEKYISEEDKINLERENEILSKQHAENIILFLSGIFILSLISVVLLLNRQRLKNQHKFELAEKEKLKLEMVSQQKELSATTLELVRSNNAYGELLQDVEEIGRTIKGDSRRYLRQLIIGQKMNSQVETWRQFNLQFEKMNSGFYKALYELEPELTESERKICALMALGLSNKEIKAVTFQPIRSIYTYKNRLRKRFSYASDEELAEMLSKLLNA